MKGVILTRFPAARVIDLAHDIPAQWPPEAGFWVSRSFQWFPAGTVHVAIVDPGVGTERDILIVEHAGHVFMAPDNGLLAQLLDNADDARVYRLDTAKIDRLQLPAASATFHGRDIFAPIAAEIAAGQLTAEETGALTTEWTPGWLDEPDVSPSQGQRRHRHDRHIRQPDQQHRRRPDQSVSRAGRQHCRTPDSDAADLRPRQPGDFLALVNSFGVVEIAKAEGSAAEGLGSARGAPLSIVDGYST